MTKKYDLQQFKLINQNKIRFVHRKKYKKTKKLSWKNNFYAPYQPYDNLWCTIIVQDIVLAYPDYSEPFEIYTDASATQPGAVITQKIVH